MNILQKVQSGTAMERVKSALEGNKLETPLISMWKHFPIDDRYPQHLVERTISFQENNKLDFIKLMYNGLYCVEDWGVHIQWPTDIQQVGKVLKYPIQTSSDWGRLKSLSIHEGAWGRELLVTKEVMKVYKGKVPVIPTVFSPLTVAWKLCGPSLIDHMKYDSDSLHRGLSIITETTIRYVKELIKHGVDGIFFATQLADFDKIDWDLYDTFGKRYDLMILSEVKDSTWFNMLHIHGLKPMFDELKDYPVQAINWHDRKSNVSLKEARSRTDKLLVGGIDEYDTLTFGTEEELESHFKDALAQVGDCKVALGPGCVIPLYIPDERLEFASQLAKKIQF